MITRLTSFVLLFVLIGSYVPLLAQDDVKDPADKPSEPEVVEKVEVAPVSSDEEISGRLYDIMTATGWFLDHDVEVNEGVVFLSGNTDQAVHREWAEKTAIRTSDVVAVVNRISVDEKPVWDLKPAEQSLRSLLRDFVTSLPLVLVALTVIAVFYLLAKIAAAITRKIFNPENDSKLLRQVVATVVGVVVFLIGLHIALRISGLTRLATTLLGGTGLIGLAIGFAFRDIAENFLSSILLSLSHPFRVGDLIEVEGTTGYVRKVTTRATVLATFEGNLVQIPNSTIYKGKITNFTSTPLRRRDFTFGIGLDESAEHAQDLVMGVLRSHAAVEQEPEPVVLVESLGSSKVNLRCYYWFDQKKHSGGKVNSILIRQTKQTLSDAGITMPDEARELVFPQEVPVRMVDATISAERRNSQAARKRPDSGTAGGEGDLHSEEEDIRRLIDVEDSDESSNILEE